MKRKMTTAFNNLVEGMLVVFICDYVFRHLFLHDWQVFVCTLIIMVAVSFILYQGTMLQRLLVASLAFVVLLTVNVIVQSLMMLVFDLSLHQIEVISAYQLLRIIVAMATGLAVCDALRIRRKHQLYYDSDIVFWLWHIILFVVAIYVCFLLFWMCGEIAHLQFNALAVVGAIGVFFSAFFTIYLYERLAMQSENLYKQQQVKKQLKTQVEHLEEIMAKHQEVRRFKHDLSNQLLMLKNFLDSGNVREGQEYLAILTQSFEKMIPLIDTGNSALDTLLSSKKTLAESKDISFNMKVQIPMQLLVAPMDLCVIFGNALDNAIEACECLENQLRVMDFTLVQQESALFCKIVNTAVPKADIGFTTRKTDTENHGFGLENIKTVLDKYDTVPIIEQNNGRFIFSFVIYL